MPHQLTTRQAVLLGWFLCGTLDLAAAFTLAWLQAARGPVAVLKGVASAVAGRGAVEGGAEMAALGLIMHFGVAFAWTLVFLWISGRSRFFRTATLVVAGPLYGAFVFCAMNFAVLPAVSWMRSLYLDTAARWPGGLGWPLLAVHLLFVGTPIVWALQQRGASPQLVHRAEVGL
jgi:hypothetical protein